MKKLLKKITKIDFLSLFLLIIYCLLTVIIIYVLIKFFPVPLNNGSIIPVLITLGWCIWAISFLKKELIIR